MTQGYDVSHWDGDVDHFDAARAGYQFAGCKATEGTGDIDPTFAHNWVGIHNAGLIRIAYHFARPEQSPAAFQAARFADTVQRAGLYAGDLLALDLEQSRLGPAATTQWAVDFLTELDQLTQRPSLIYCGPGFIRGNLVNPQRLTRWRLWLAQYGPVAHPWPWAAPTIWQYSQTGRVPGVPTACDLNRTTLTAEQLRQIGTPTPVAPAPQVPTAFQLDMLNICRRAQKPPLPDATPATWAECVREFCLLYDATFHQHYPMVDALDDAWNGRVGQCATLILAQ